MTLHLCVNLVLLSQLLAEADTEANQVEFEVMLGPVDSDYIFSTVYHRLRDVSLGVGLRSYPVNLSRLATDLGRTSRCPKNVFKLLFCPCRDHSPPNVLLQTRGSGWG